jgi:hypothetical protein
MHNNPLFLNRMSLDAAFLPGDGDTVFHKGELLQGLVKGINADGLVALWLKGRLIEAATQVKVEAGQTLMLMVDEVEAGQIRLKVMTPAGLQKTETETIAARLMEIGISPRDIHIQLARYLLAYNLPLNRSTLELMLKGTAILGGATRENMNLTAFQLSQGLPQHPAVLLALAQYVNPGSNVNSLRQDIIQLLSNAPNIEFLLQQAGADNPRASAPQATANPAPVPVDTAPAPGPAADSGTNRTPLSANTNIASSTPPPSNLNTTSAGLTMIGKDLLNQVLTLVRHELTVQEVQASQSTPVLASRIGEMLRRQPELLRGLLLLQNLLEISVKDGQQSLALTLQTKLQSYSRELLGQQVINLVPPPSQGDAPQCYFSFPVQIGEQQRLCEFRIYGEEGQASLKDREQINVAISMDTPRLGPVAFHLSWHASRLIEMRSVVTKQASYRLMAPHLPELHQALRELGYTVRDHGLKIVPPGSADTTLKVLPQPPAEPNRGPWLKVDIKV